MDAAEAQATDCAGSGWDIVFNPVLSPYEETDGMKFATDMLVAVVPNRQLSAAMKWVSSSLPNSSTFHLRRVKPITFATDATGLGDRVIRKEDLLAKVGEFRWDSCFGPAPSPAAEDGPAAKRARLSPAPSSCSMQQAAYVAPPPTSAFWQQQLSFVALGFPKDTASLLLSIPDAVVGKKASPSLAGFFAAVTPKPSPSPAPTPAPAPATDPASTDSAGASGERSESPCAFLLLPCPGRPALTVHEYDTVHSSLYPLAHRPSPSAAPAPVQSPSEARAVAALARALVAAAEWSRRGGREPGAAAVVDTSPAGSGDASSAVDGAAAEVEAAVSATGWRLEAFVSDGRLATETAASLGTGNVRSEGKGCERYSLPASLLPLPLCSSTPSHAGVFPATAVPTSYSRAFCLASSSAKGAACENQGPALPCPRPLRHATLLAVDQVAWLQAARLRATPSSSSSSSSVPDGADSLGAEAGGAETAVGGVTASSIAAAAAAAGISAPAASTTTAGAAAWAAGEITLHTATISSTGAASSHASPGVWGVASAAHPSGAAGCALRVAQRIAAAKPSQGVRSSCAPLEEATSEPQDEGGRQYLCTGLDLFLYREPCMQCAMAALHARFRRVWFLHPNPAAGGLGSVFALHTSQYVNHRFDVFQITYEKRAAE